MGSENWIRNEGFPRTHQATYTVLPYRSLRELISNGRTNVLVVAAHQDDEVIGMGGTMGLYSEGVILSDDPLVDLDPRTFALGGLKISSKSVIRDIQERLAKGGIDLRLLPEEPSNVIALYLTNGAKTEKTVLQDISAAYPDRPLSQHFGRFNVSNLTELTARLNQLRYPETLAGLNTVGASAAIFLDYPSAEIKPKAEGRQRALRDLSEAIKFINPDVIYTLSPFDFSHDTHLLTSSLTLQAVRNVFRDRAYPQFRGYPVWDPDKHWHREIVDISAVLGDKLDAIHMHSVLGSQSTFGREYERMVGVNIALATALVNGWDGFNAVMQRPRLPGGINAVEIFINMDPLLKNNNMSLRQFVMTRFQTSLRQYPQI